MKTFSQLSMLILFPLLLAGCTTVRAPEIPEGQVTGFEECVAMGNPVMESYPRQCSHNGQVFIEEIEEVDSPVSQDDRKPCTREYMPVCGEVQVQCIKAPCPPIKTTFSNRCEAENADATNIADGVCEDEAPNPEGACLSFDGNWLSDSQECEGMSKEQCETLGGIFNECASACRNDPEAEICTMQCVIVCQF